MNSEQSSPAAMRGFLIRAALFLLLLFATDFAVAMLRFDNDPGTAEAQFFPLTPDLNSIFSIRTDLWPSAAPLVRYKTSSIGLRAREFQAQDTNRILVLGSSVAECKYLDQEQTWPLVLEQRLGTYLSADTWVGNSGDAGKNSRHHLLTAKHYPLESQKIDLVVAIVGETDLLLALAALEESDPTFMQRSDAEERLLRVCFPARAIMQTSDMKASLLYISLRSLKTRVLRKNSASDDLGTEYELARYRNENRPFLTELPDMTAALDEYESNLRELALVLSSKDIKLVLVTAAAIWRNDLTSKEEAALWLGGVGTFQNERGGHDYYSPAALRRGLDTYNAVTRRVAQDLELTCVDLDGLPRSLDVFYDGNHFTAHGASLVAELLTGPVGDLLLDE